VAKVFMALVNWALNSATCVMTASLEAHASFAPINTVT
jgi:hypothetical protein